MNKFPQSSLTENSERKLQPLTVSNLKNPVAIVQRLWKINNNKIKGQNSMMNEC